MKIEKIMAVMVKNWLRSGVSGQKPAAGRTELISKAALPILPAPFPEGAGDKVGGVGGGAAFDCVLSAVADAAVGAAFSSAMRFLHSLAQWPGLWQ